MKLKQQFQTFRKIWKFNAVFIFLAGIAAMTVVSRAADSFMVPYASVASPEAKKLKYPLEIQGRIAPKENLAICCPKGLQIAQVHVQVSDTVEKGSLLFTVDLGSLQGSIAQAEQELQKLELQIKDLTRAWQRQASQHSLDLKRAKEDYNDTLKETEAAVNAALLELEHAKAELSLHASQKPEETASQQRANSSQNPQSPSATPDSALPMENPMDAWAAKQAELEQVCLEKQKLYEEAATSRKKALKAAARQVEDASLPLDKDSAADLLQIEQASLNLTLQELKELRKAGGKVYAESSGQVLECPISTGSFTSLEPAIILADFSHPFQFEGALAEASLFGTETPAIEEGMEGSLKAGEGEISLEHVKISRISQGEAGTCQVSADLAPHGTLQPGEAVLSLETESQDYPCCIPLSALYSRESGDFVIRVQESPSILGIQPIAEYVPVEVLEKNSQYAAVEGALSPSDCIIVSASKAIKEGDRIRITKD